MNEKDGPGGDDGPDAFDHTELETLGRAVIDYGRGLVRFGADYKYLDADERETRRQSVGRIVALMNSLWPQMDADIKADRRLAVTSHERDARNYHTDRLFRMMEVATKKPPNGEGDE